MVSGAIQGLSAMISRSAATRPSTLDSIRKIELALLETLRGMAREVYSPIESDDELPDVIIKFLLCMNVSRRSLVKIDSSML